MATLTMMVILVPFSYGFSEEAAVESEKVTVEGEVGAEGVYAGVRANEGGRAKFTEYRDLRQGFSAFGKIGLEIDSEKYFLKFRASDMGYDTQSYEIEDGMWGKFKFDLFYDEIPHNLTFDARTFFQGAGSHDLTGRPTTNFNTWNTFDYSVDRKQYGGGFKVLMLKPFYFDVSFQRENRDGIKPAGSAPGSSPGTFDVELPEPIHYATSNLKVEGGYAKKPLFLSFGFIYSDFNDGQDKLNFTHPVTPFPTDTLTLPPDNRYYKGFFKGAVKLPFNSKFNVNIGYSSAMSDTTLLNQFITNGTINPVVLSKPDFDGRVDTQNYSFALTSNPVRFIDTKIFYSYYKKDNKNDVIFQNEPTLGAIEFNKPFEYKKQEAGVDLGVKLPASLYLSGGFKYIDTDRKVKGIELFEAIEGAEAAAEIALPDNKDNIWSVDLKWSGLDFLSARVGYERFNRSADFPVPTMPTNRRFAYAGQGRDTYKASVDLFPIENFNFSFGYQHKNTDYKEILGLRSDRRDEFEISTDYAIGKIAKLYGFIDYESIRFNQVGQRTEAIATPGNWDAKQKDRSWGYGIGTEIYVIPKKLSLIFQHDYLKSNGNVDLTLDPVLFAASGIAGANNDIIDIMNWDDYTKYSVKIKAVYNFTKSLTGLIGYAYERYNFKDAQLDGYNFTPTGGTTNTGFLTGAYKDQSYKANLIFGGMTYKF